jgi:cardiolipin synthase
MKDRRQPSLHAGHDLRLLQGWQELFPALVKAIEHSTREVRLESYIFASDTAGGRHSVVLRSTS